MICMYVCVCSCAYACSCVSGSVRTFCQRTNSGVGPHLSPCLRWSLLSFALCTTAYLVCRLLGSVSDIGSLGLQMHDTCYCSWFSWGRGLLCVASAPHSGNLPSPVASSLCAKREFRQLNPSMPSTTSDLSTGNCVTNGPGRFVGVRHCSPASASPAGRLGRG